jgi:hypothetical protein
VEVQQANGWLVAGAVAAGSFSGTSGWEFPYPSIHLPLTILCPSRGKDWATFSAFLYCISRAFAGFSPVVGQLLKFL